MRYAPMDTPGVAHHEASAEEDRAQAELVMACVLSFENGIGQDAKDRFDRFYTQYRGFRKWADAWTKAGPNDKDGMLYDAKRHWGAHLHIPLSYRTIEHMVPKSIAHAPKLLYMPRHERWEENVEAVRLLIDAQQENIDIDLPFQSVMRSGRIYGLGVGKPFWRKEYIKRRRVKRRTFAGDLLGGMFTPRYGLGRPESVCVFDDPDFEDVDVYDFMWDPFGSDTRLTTRRCGWVVHRVWLSLDDCMDRIESGAWNTASVEALKARGRVEEELRGMSSGATRYDTIWNERMLASGLPSFNTAGRGEHVHELLEWHDGERVSCMLDRGLLVQDAQNPVMGALPFPVYRPTPLQGQMIGIGDMEPLEHLQRELDTTRSQMTDAITIALCAGFAYDENAIDEEDLVFGPASAIPVRNARVGDAIVPLPRPDVSASAFQHMQTTRQDFDAVAGVTEALDPAQGGQISTATQAQLVQAALSARIALGARRFELEVGRQTARCFLFLDQRMILEGRSLRQPDEGLDMVQAAQEGRWRWVQVGPGELQGEFEIIPESGSMAARNVPQDRQDAQIFFSLAANNPHIDPRRPLMKGLELCGIKDPQAWLKQTDPPVPPMALQLLEESGVPRELIANAVAVAQRADPRLADPEQAQGPGVQQVDAMMQLPEGAPA